MNGWAVTDTMEIWSNAGLLRTRLIITTGKRTSSGAHFKARFQIKFAEGRRCIYPKAATSTWPQEETISLWPSSFTAAAESTAEVRRGRNFAVLGVFGEKLDIFCDPVDLKVFCQKVL